MDNATNTRTDSGKPMKQSFHDRKIAELEAKKRRPPPQPTGPGFRGAPPPSKQLSDEDQKINNALDRMIQLWKDQKEKVKDREGQLKENFKKGKIKGKAKYDFER